MSAGFQIFEQFEQEKFIHMRDLPHMKNYICSNLNSQNINYRFWYNQYTYSNIAYTVYVWRQRKGLMPVAKWSEAICNNELVNVFKEHRNCPHGCGFVYYK